MPAAELCASPTDSSTAFSILKLGTFHGNQHFSPVPGLGPLLVLAYYWLVSLPSSWVGSLLSTNSELLEGTGCQDYKKQKNSHSFLCCLSRHYTELQNVVGPTCMQMNGGKLVTEPETDFDVTHPGLAAVKFICSTKRLHIPISEWERERQSA